MASEEQCGLSTPESRRRHACSICGTSYSTVSNLNQHGAVGQHYLSHVNSHSNIKQFCCDICSKEFCYESSLKVHYRKHHMEENLHQGFTFTDKPPYVCGNCGKAYRLKTSYYQHVKRYHVDPALFCNHCGKKFYSRYDLNRHQVIHTGVKAFTCDFCGAKFFTVGTLKIHVKRVHGTPFEYYCKFCGKGYHDKEGLWLHERGHYDADMNFEGESSDVQDVS
ncbi:zinc finger protein 2-like [Haliotis cracherodii]|uniref:zinc finger protein 2-like n=1 Tax=Haliotis cracherodii TaxID=6455 RepID=UPI0039EC15E5